MASFGKAVDASRGTVVFGNGVSALAGEIAHTGDDDYLIVEGNPVGVTPRLDDDDNAITNTYVVPLASIVYVKVWGDKR